MDDAGKKAAVRAIEILKDAGFNDIRIINTKPYKDPDEIIQKEGMEGYRSRIKTSSPSWRYMLNIITEQQSFVNDVGLLNAPWTKLKELILGKLKRVDPDPSYGLLIVLSNIGIVFAAKHGFHPGDKGLGQFHFILQKAV